MGRHRARGSVRRIRDVRAVGAAHRNHRGCEGARMPRRRPPHGLQWPMARRNGDPPGQDHGNVVAGPWRYRTDARTRRHGVLVVGEPSVAALWIWRCGAIRRGILPATSPAGQLRPIAAQPGAISVAAGERVGIAGGRCAFTDTGGVGQAADGDRRIEQARVSGGGELDFADLGGGMAGAGDEVEGGGADIELLDVRAESGVAPGGAVG